MKRILTLIIAITMFICVIPFYTNNVYAAVVPYSSLNLAASQFDIVASGSIKAMKVKGEWCYKFSKNGKVVYIKASAFKNSKLNNSTANVNKELTTQINKFKPSHSVAYLYKEKLTNAKDVYAGGCAVHRWRINKYVISETSTLYDLSLKCEVKDGVYFTYNDKVKRNGKTVVPSTANDYKNALKRYHNTIYNSAKKPVFCVNIDKPGSNRTYMSQYNMTGKGTWKVKAKPEWGDYVKVAYSSAKVVKSAVTGGPVTALKSVWGMAYKASNPRYTRGVYSSTREYYLSNVAKNKYCLKATFESPIVIKDRGTYFKTKVFFATPISKKNIKTVRTITFALK